MVKRREMRKNMRRKFRRKSRLPGVRGTERIWMECYRGDPRRLHLQRRQGSRRHQPKAVREIGRPCMLDLETLQFVCDTIDAALEIAIPMGNLGEEEEGDW